MMEENKTELELSDWQYELLADIDSDELVVTAGYGTGKSFALAFWTLDRLAYNPRVDAIFTEPTWSLVRSVAIPAFETAFATIGWNSRDHYKAYLSPSFCRIELVTGQKIVFFSCEEPSSIVGVTVGVAAMDEVALCSKDAYKAVKARLRDTKANKLQLAMGTTPEGDNWFSDDYDSDSQDGWHALTSERDKVTYREVELPGGKTHTVRIRRFRATTFSNEHNLGPTYIPNLLDTHRHNQNYIDSYVYGYFRPFASGLAYSNYRSQLHRMPSALPNPDKPIHLTWDFNIEPQWVSIQEQSEFNDWQHKKTFWQTVHNADEGHDNLEDACIEFMTKHPRNAFARTPVYIYGDPTGHHRSHKARLSDFAEIKKILHRLGYKNVVISAIKAAPLERVSVDYVQQQLAENTFRVGANCGKVLKSIVRTAWKNGEKGKLDKPPGETWTHPMDAVKYFFCAIAQNAGRKLISGRV